MSTVLKYALRIPSFEEVSILLQEKLVAHFSNVVVEVVECPNLTKEPFMLSSEGLCGKPTVADVGGVPYLVPVMKNQKKYNLKDVAKAAEIDNAFVIGAACGPIHHVGVINELMPNVKFGEIEVNKTHMAKMQDDNYVLEKLPTSTEFCLLGNLFLSEGKPGKVLRINVSQRLSNDNFVSIIRKILADHYKDQAVAVGGVFLIKKGKAKLHVMPNYHTVPLNTDEDVDKWLNYFTMNAPLICLSCFVSHDPGLDLRIEHTHCFSQHGDGGHYHYDTTPEKVEYLAYFNLAETILRMDPPEETHSVGRD